MFNKCYNCLLLLMEYMEHRITTSEIPAQCQDTENYTGLLVHIRPPVQLNPDAVERYLIRGDFEQLDGTESQSELDVKDVGIVGNTPEQTTIYASTRTYNDAV